MLDAFLPLCCGAFISRSQGLLINDALQFVVVRDGTHTTVAVQNRYKGPAEEFALLVPVPAVLHEGDVKTLTQQVFDAYEIGTAPKLDLLEEKDPCAPENLSNTDGARAAGGAAPPGQGASVRVESQFSVGEYDVAVLSSSDAAALFDWLKANRYVLPPELEKQLKPYIAEGYKFFVAKVNIERLKLAAGGTDLSPLRFEYDEPELKLPLRLSAASSPGVQDVLVYALTRGKKMEAANRPNQLMPTGLELSDEAVDHFPEFYATLFQSVVAKQPDTVVTEWVGGTWRLPQAALEAMNVETRVSNDWQLTRLHLQVDRNGKLDDLVLRQAAQPDNGYAASYVHKKLWTGAISCANPRYDRFEPAGKAGQIAKRDVKPYPVDALSRLVIDPAKKPARPPGKAGGCCESGGAPPAAPLAVVMAGLALAARRRRRCD